MEGGEVLGQGEMPELALHPGVLLAHLTLVVSIQVTHDALCTHHHHPECLGPHHVQLQLQPREDDSLSTAEKLLLNKGKKYLEKIITLSQVLPVS